MDILMLKTPKYTLAAKTPDSGCLFHVSPWMISGHLKYTQNGILSFQSNRLQTQPSLLKFMATPYFLLLGSEILIILDFFFSHIPSPFIQRNHAGLPSKPII
ncbi:unnamed protein product [Rangifer tarandus platyrhynchus]|uniref:Uncharacterized protein n=2 Tax=Rangifer tarandus platyrhynchus TaxID=3082113 RepID=A0AC59Z5N9_RANTA|nr:unnamed protein product [Rangifer tarandus platyrhynchus]